MNKLKKVAATAVSIVMAGSLASALTACGNHGGTSGPVIDKLEYASGTKVTTAIGYQDDATATSFSTTTLPLAQGTNHDAEGVTSVKLPDGKTYQKGALKPIWQSYQTALDISITDKWPRQKSGTLGQCVQEGLSNFDLISAGSLDEIQKQINAGTLLNLAEYLDLMPNLKNFLEENTLAELGTLSNTKTGAMYYSPYYAGMNDTERFNLFRTDYVSELLDHADLTQAATKNGGTVTFKAQADKKKELQLGGRGASETYVSNAASIKSYMGKVEADNYIVKTIKPGTTNETIFVKVNYKAALDAAKDDTTKLGAAIKKATITTSNATGTVYTGTGEYASGNIVDLQNFAINQTAGEVKGEDLLNILREYIEVAYEWSATENGTYAKFYNNTVGTATTKRSDVFNSNYATWDVDLYAAIGRVFVTCGNLLGQYQAQTSEYTNNGGSTWLFVTRTGKLDRLTRQTAMIGELYGVRGMEGMTYLDSSGTLRQARFNVSTWDAMQKFSAFHTEGLVPSFYNATTADTQSTGKSGENSIYNGSNAHFQALSSNDFVHTQAVLKGKEYAEAPYATTTDGYCWTAVSTPVSRWLTQDTSTVSASGAISVDVDGKLEEWPKEKTTVMRFTESALKLKTGGLVIPKSTANNKDKLAATLALMDYVYSNDGQIVTTFGEVSTRDNLTGDKDSGYETTNDGWWYGKEVTSVQPATGDAIAVTGKTMEELKALGVVTNHVGKVQEEEDGGTKPSTKVLYDGSEIYTIADAYKSQALVYKNKLYITGTNSTENGGVNTYDNGYVYHGVMTPYYTQAVRKLATEQATVNGYHIPDKKNEKKDENGNVISTTWSSQTWSSTNLQNQLLGMESHGVVNNASMVQLCNEDSLKGFDIISAGLATGAIQTVTQGIGENPWYTCAPSVTLSSSASKTINGYTDFTNLFATKSGSTLLCNYLFTEVAWYGAAANFNTWTVSDKTGDLSTPEGVAAHLKKIAPQYETLNNSTWSAYYKYYQDKNK